MNTTGFTAAKSALLAATRPRRAELASALAEAKGLEDERRALFLELLGDADLKTVSVAIRCLGDLPSENVEAALLAKLANGARPEQRRALARALGTAGSEAARAPLQMLMRAEDDPELQRQAERALALLDRRLVRAKDLGMVDATRKPIEPLALALRMRVGLESFVRDELAQLGVTPESETPGRIHILWERPLGQLFAVRIAEAFAFRFVLPKDATEAQILAALAEPELAATLARHTRGPVRYRLFWKDAKDADRFRLLKALATQSPTLINDSREAVWEVELDPAQGRLEILPKRLDDPRFTYRRALVPASSHAPLAAALARLAGVRKDDVVWDPFVGAASELVERAKRGHYRRLIGTDIDPAAVNAARENLAAALVKDVEIIQGDAREIDLGVTPTLLISNPPLGRRVGTGEAPEILRQVLERAAPLLAPGGRMVFVTPDPDGTDALLTGLGLRKTEGRAVDMGGFPAWLRRFDKPH